MNLFADAIAWIFNPEQWTGTFGIPTLLLQHLAFTFGSVLIAMLIAIPIGFFIGHTGIGREIAVGISGAARALPTFGLILLLILVLGVTRTAVGATISFVILAIPSVLAGAYAGIQAVDRTTIDAARAIGMTEMQILWKVEVPLGLPLLVAGIRSAVLQVVATVTLAGYVNLGGLGYPIIQGISLRSYEQILGGALVVIMLALLLDLLLGLATRAAEPRGRGRKAASRPVPAAA